MLDLDKDSKDILKVALIGGVLGICAASIYFASKSGEKKDNSSLSSLGRVISQVGELLDSQNVVNTSIAKDVDKKIHKHENTISDVLEFIAAGMNLWEKIRKGS